MTRYVCGFMFSADRRHVALIRKAKPAWQAGMLNGIGGKIEEGERPFCAMVREFQEEAGIEIVDWEEFAVLTGPDFQIHFFATFGDRVFDVRTMEQKGEVVLRLPVDALRDQPLIPNLRVLIPLALDRTGIVKPVHLADERKAA